MFGSPPFFFVFCPRRTKKAKKQKCLPFPEPRVFAVFACHKRWKFFPRPFRGGLLTVFGALGRGPNAIPHSVWGLGEPQMQYLTVFEALGGPNCNTSQCVHVRSRGGASSSPPPNPPRHHVRKARGGYALTQLGEAPR